MANELDDFQPSRDYVQMWDNAKKIRNFEQLDSIFKSLCSEVGIVDPRSDASQAAAGKALAERLNTNSSDGVKGKKV